MKIEIPGKSFAFKEWSLVCGAIASGHQTVILRKGGISEGKRGFEWLHDRFFLFPTLFHAQMEKIRIGEADNAVEVFSQPEGTVRIGVYVETLRTSLLKKWEEVTALAPFHIWTPDTVRERFEWGDEPGIFVAVIRAYRLKDPLVLRDRDAFGGCRSWIGLPREEVPSSIDAEAVEPICGIPPLPEETQN